MSITVIIHIELSEAHYTRYPKCYQILCVRIIDDGRSMTLTSQVLLSRTAN